MTPGELRGALNLFVLRTGSERAALASISAMTGLSRSTVYDFRRNTRKTSAPKTIDRLNMVFDEGEWSEFGGKRGPAYGLKVEPKGEEGFSGDYWIGILRPPKGTVRYMIIYMGLSRGRQTGSTGWRDVSSWGDAVELIDPLKVIAVFFDIPRGSPV